MSRRSRTGKLTYWAIGNRAFRGGRLRMARFDYLLRSFGLSDKIITMTGGKLGVAAGLRFEFTRQEADGASVSGCVQRVTSEMPERTNPFQELVMLMPLGKPDSRGILKIEAPPIRADLSKGPSWVLKNGVWIESTASDVSSVDTD